jgi:hypothetical protein
MIDASRGELSERNVIALVSIILGYCSPYERKINSNHDATVISYESGVFYLYFLSK